MSNGSNIWWCPGLVRFRWLQVIDLKFIHKSARLWLVEMCSPPPPSNTLRANAIIIIICIRPGSPWFLLHIPSFSSTLAKFASTAPSAQLLSSYRHCSAYVSNKQWNTMAWFGCAVRSGFATLNSQYVLAFCESRARRPLFPISLANKLFYKYLSFARLSVATKYHL